jgi:hypothetical protein
MFSVASEGKQRRASRGVTANTRPASQRQAPTLQSMYGNQAVLRWTSAASAGGATLQRKCACGGSGGHCDCDKKEHEQGLMRKAAGTNPASRVPPVVHEVLQSPGRPLEGGTRSMMEPRFGHDFGGVRVHTDARAAESARAVNALAYTVGPNVVFGAGQYVPGSADGRRLLAHELAHVVQQSGTAQSARPGLTIGPADSPLERDADRSADAAFSGGMRPASAPVSVLRQVDPGAGAGGQPSAAAPANQAGARDESSDYRELTEQEKAAIAIVGQAAAPAATPDGNSLGPTDAAHEACLGTRFFFSGGAGANTTTSATGRSRVTARLGAPPKDAADCSCGCALFRQYVRGFVQLGSPTSPKVSPLTTGSCPPNTITLSENTFTEEFENCNPGGSPLGPGCERTYLDGPGFGSGLSEGTFVHLHFVLRYQIWDQCRGRSLGMADHVLDISGSRHPRRITFT